MRDTAVCGLVICGAALLALGMTRNAPADETAVQLKSAPDAAFVVSKCSICHSVDYIQMNAPFMKRAGWETEVRKMMKLMGAPLEETDFTRVVDYLTLQYGSG